MARLTAYRWPIGEEEALQSALATVLALEGFTATREYALGRCGRVDFYIPALKLGIELKVHGSPSAVARQLRRYMDSPAIETLMLVTGRTRLSALPEVLGGKPLLTVVVYGGLV